MKLKRERQNGFGNQMAGGCLSLFGLPFLLAGLVVTGLYFSGFMTWWDARSWVEVPCQIDSAELKESHGSDSTSYSLEASYHYEFQEQSYLSDRVSFGKGADNVGDFHQRTHRKLANHRDSGRAFRCFVDPEHPENAVLYRGLRWEMQGFLAIFALTFPAVGAVLVAGGILSGRAEKRAAALKQRHPQEPWKWKHAWAGTAIPEQAVGLGSAYDLYTLWSALVIFPLIGATAASGAFATDKWAWVLAVYIVIWCIPAGFTLKRIRKRRVMGKAVLELAEMPVWPGRRMTGHVVLEKPLPVYGDPELLLICEKVMTVRTGKGTSISREEVWRESVRVPSDRVTRDISGYRVPVDMVIPADAPVSGGDDGVGEKHVWALRLKLPMSKVNALFEVPVFGR